VNTLTTLTVLGYARRLAGYQLPRLETVLFKAASA